MKKLSFLLLTGFGFFGFSQSNPDRYIKIGLENNEVIKQKNFDISKSLYALKEAKSMFYPSVGLIANYTIADG